MSDATKLMEEMFAIAMRYKTESSDQSEADIHLVKAGGLVAATGMMSQLGVPPEHTERLYQAAVDGMAAEAERIRGES